MAFMGKRKTRPTFTCPFFFTVFMLHHQCSATSLSPSLFFPLPWKLPALLHEFVELFLGVISHRPTAGAGLPINSRLDASANLTSRTRQSFEN